MNANLHLDANNYSAIALKNENCIFCNGRYFCPHFSSFLEEGIYNRNIDVAGKLQEFTRTKVGYNLIIENNNILKQILSLSKDYISSQNLTKLVNNEVIVFNTVRSKNDNLIYYGTKNSTIFKSPLNE